MNQLVEQMQTLMKQANEIKNRVELSERIYDAEIGFEPIIGHRYHVYQKENGKDVISMIAPSEWGRSYKYARYLGEVLLLADHTWDVLEYHSEEGENA